MRLATGLYHRECWPYARIAYKRAGDQAVYMARQRIAYLPQVMPHAATAPIHERSKCRHIFCAGTLRSCDPDRVVLKKIVLSGYPVKVHKKKAVVRWMFHNPEDVRWFKPLELWTKYGRRGRIKVSRWLLVLVDMCSSACANRLHLAPYQACM